ncbi:MAG: TonB-dependent receptor [Bacteroidales bacterium]|nr:TonB-dependent receptor [Bacteroidales bacterium]MCD8395269.1 TonB-dependent receptor [Bacteroidales bacterium]
MKPLSLLKTLCLLAAMLIALPVSAQQIQVKGTVLDTEGEPLIGATVHVKGTSAACATDIDGQFTIEAQKGATLAVSYVGYKRVEVKAAPELTITMEVDNALDEVVVIGYGSVKRSDVTTAVSTVSSKDIENRPIVSAAQALQGKAAGVAVSSPNGAPGGTMTIRVRGTTSFNGDNDPLYVVDGVPVDNVSWLAPSDIESMQILKDASSAAIYGSRAANGVVLITTRGANTRDAKVTLNIQGGFTRVAKKLDVLNAAQYKDLQDEIGLVTLPDGLTDQTDWFDETYRTGSTQTYQVSISQRADKMSYYLGLGYTKEKGIIESSYFQRYNFRAAVEGTIKKWLKVNTNIVYSDYSSNGGGAMGTGSNRGGVVLAVVNTPTYAPVWDPDNPNQYYNNFYGVNITSPLENEAREANNRNKENRLIASGELLFDFLPVSNRLTLRSKLTLDRRNSINTTFLDPISTTWGRNQYGEASDNRATNTLLVWDNVLTWDQQFNKHKVTVMAGTSWTDSDYRYSYINGSHYLSDAIQTLNAANKISWDGTGTSASEWGIMSYFGRASYNFDSKYLLTANIRIDGSSKLHPDHRWKAFPSVSAAWRMSQESWLNDKTWLNDLKIRAGWGQTGNQGGIGDYAYLQRYNITRQQWFNDEIGENALPILSQANLRTTDLKWETTTQTNVGIDVSFFNSRLTFTADAYYKKTKDMLMWVSLPSGAAAASSIQRNEGEMTNKGLEFAVSGHPFQGRGFNWSIDANISFNRNKLDKLALQQVYYDAKTSETVNEYAVRNEPGRALGCFYGYISDGVDPETGELMYRDLNGDGRISSSDRTYIGDPNPDFTYGMTNVFSWKGFTLSIFIQGSYGNDIFNASRMETEGMYDGKNQTTRVLNRWRIPGQVTDVPKAGFDMKNSTYFVEDGSYLRVKDISLSYDIQGKWMSKLGISRLQPYFTATNLLTFTNYKGMDPEVNQWGSSGAVQGIDWGTYPQCKSFVFGVNVEF